MDITHLTNFNEFVIYFRGDPEKPQPSHLDLLNRVSIYLEGFTLSGITEIIYRLYGKWPHCDNKDILINGARRAIQANFYSKLYDREQSIKVLEKDKEILAKLDLRDTPRSANVEKKVIASIKKTERKQEKERIQQMPKTQRPKSEFSQQVATKSLEEVIKWAQELNISKEKIDKHKSKPLGLAKMNIANLIKGQLNRNEKTKS
jgi:hypothetical protein